MITYNILPIVPFSYLVPMFSGKSSNNEKTKSNSESSNEQQHGQSRVFSSSDGDFLIVPQEGSLLITTEFGKVKFSRFTSIFFNSIQIVLNYLSVMMIEPEIDSIV